MGMYKMMKEIAVYTGLELIYNLSMYHQEPTISLT